MTDQEIIISLLHDVRDIFERNLKLTERMVKIAEEQHMVSLRYQEMQQSAYLTHAIPGSEQ